MQNELTIIKPKETQKRKKKQPKRHFWWLIVLFSVLILGAVGVVVFDEDGKPEILPERKQKLKEELAKYDKAEQYALFAKSDGFYPCPSCSLGDSVYLFAGEIWKYGVSVNGKNRYTAVFLDAQKLGYKTEYIGEIGECLKLEKIKIYTYPTLPENLKRKVKLLRPPGNPVDR
jgi:hypothetical protein